MLDARTRSMLRPRSQAILSLQYPRVKMLAHPVSRSPPSGPREGTDDVVVKGSCLCHSQSHDGRLRRLLLEDLQFRRQQVARHPTVTIQLC